MSSQTYQLVRQAIIERKAISATYNGAHREMCPHVLGTKLGKPQGLFYQYGGASNSRPIQPDGSPNNWRCIEIGKLSSVTLIDTVWHTAPNHSRPSTCVGIGEVDVAVTY
jgi:hypothetical protein